jgi:aminomethyltransferase
MSPSTSAVPPAPPLAAPLRRTPLYDLHLRQGALMVPFAGWEMPLHYGSIVDEHVAVRTSVGLFDVSHMGILAIGGASAPSLLSRRTTANFARLVPGQCRYTFLLDDAGRIVDDLIGTRIDTGIDQPPAFVVVPNAAKAERIFDLFREHRKPDTTVSRHNGEVAILAVQGPNSRDLLARTFGWSLDELSPYHGRFFPVAVDGRIPRTGELGSPFPAGLEDRILVSRTGYTGELGFELFVRGREATGVAERLQANGARLCGLGARDTLRLEKGYLLSGQDFARDRTPLEAGQDRFIEFDHAFVGRDALEKQRREGLPARLVGLVIEDGTSIPRHGTPVFQAAQSLGAVTSGGFSPTLHRGIALAFLPVALAAPGTAVELEIRGRRVPARVTPLPFVSARKSNA